MLKPVIASGGEVVLKLWLERAAYDSLFVGEPELLTM